MTGDGQAPRVSVVVAHYEQQHGLDLVLGALDVAEPVPGGFEVVVADDGSADLPRVGTHAYPVRVVGQEPGGFRAAAARNLGARAARGQLLSFLDADTVPTPGYLASAVRTAAGPGALVVGRRTHVDLAGWSPQALQDWWAGAAGTGPQAFTDPEWLAQGYRETQDLRSADDTSFRFVISAVLTVARPLWDRLGGFDESFTDYGGEDWELAQRAWLAGADLAHEPRALALHDGPDLAGRSGDVATVKNTETLHLARRLTHPLVRGAGLVHAVPDVVVEADVHGWSLGQVVLAVQALLAAGDVGVWLTGTDARARGALVEDPRVHEGAPAPEVASRCRFRVRLTRPVAWCGGSLLRAVADDDRRADPGDAVQVHSTRDLGRALLLGHPPVTPRGVRPDRVRELPADTLVERWRQRADRDR